LAPSASVCQTDLVQNQRQRTAALAAAPAVNQWRIRRGLSSLTLCSAMFCLATNTPPSFFGLELADLFVLRADFSLIIMQTKASSQRREGGLQRIRLQAGVDHGGKLAQSGQGVFRRNTVKVWDDFLQFWPDIGQHSQLYTIDALREVDAVLEISADVRHRQCP
jgi:hypothetical protein